jgi:hypothetical protein
MESQPARRKPVLILGAVLALAAGALIAGWLVWSHRNDAPPPPPASQGGLIVETQAPDDGGVDPALPLRCFVSGQYVGEITLAECAQRNGVAAGALDVGLDESGALAAADQAGTVLVPLPPAEAAAPAEALPPEGEAPAPAAAPVGGCWRYSGSEWRRIPGDLTLSACVQTLYAGRCERPGGAAYGRWMQQTLRLVVGRIEISPDNRSFRTLVEQGPGCTIAAVG